jgi:histidinol-phosphate aminotransferase
MAEVNRPAGAILYDPSPLPGGFDLEYLPSQTNFVMHRITGDLATYMRRMHERGFAVGRPFPPMLGSHRISLGLPEEMEAPCRRAAGLPAAGWV